jgi:hypothetical protein
MALRWNNWRYRFVAIQDDSPVDKSVKEGGAQIEFEDEDPMVHEMFEASLAKVGAQCKMGLAVPHCTQRPTQKAS